MSEFKKQLAREIFIEIMKTGSGIAEFPKEERIKLFVLGAEIAIEMADAFESTINK
jgi:hypothetical protein